MTFEEGRALFPVLETVAYLNAGTFGPLAEPVARAQAASLERDLAQGRSGLGRAGRGADAGSDGHRRYFTNWRTTPKS